MHPRFVGPFTVIPKNAYPINILHKLRTHSVFYVGFLEPNLDPSLAEWEKYAPVREMLPHFDKASSSIIPGHSKEPCCISTSEFLFGTSPSSRMGSFAYNLILRSIYLLMSTLHLIDDLP